MRHSILIGLALWLALVGVWNHDWRLIVAGVGFVVVWPLVGCHVYTVAHERTLDELWDDGDDPDWVREARAEIDKLPETIS